MMIYAKIVSFMFSIIWLTVLELKLTRCWVSDPDHPNYEAGIKWDQFLLAIGDDADHYWWIVSHWLKLVCTEASMPFDVWVCFWMSIGLIDGCPPQNNHCSISVFSTLWFELKRIQGDWEVQHQNGAQPRPWADSEPHWGVSEEALEQERQPEQDERDGGGGEGLVGRYQHS